jgi:hypothetical protein
MLKFVSSSLNESVTYSCVSQSLKSCSVMKKKNFLHCNTYLNNFSFEVFMTVKI